MAIQGDIKDLDLPLLINTAAFRRGVVEVECPPLGTVLIYFRDGKVVSIVRNGELLENLLEILDTVLSLVRCRSGTFLMENLDDTDVEIPESISIDANQFTLLISSLIDEIEHRPEGPPDDLILRLVTERAKNVRDPLDAAFLLLAMEYLVRGTTLRELRRNLPIRDDTLEYFVARLLERGLIEVVEDKAPETRAERTDLKGTVKVFLRAEDDVRRTVLKVLRDMGYEAEVYEGEPTPDARIYVVDLNGKGFLWANALFGPYASRTLLIGSEELKPTRFRYIRKPLNEEEVRRALEELLST